MKRFNLLIIIGGLLVITLASCKSNFLNYQPKGVVSSSQLNTPKRADQLVTAAYASLGNDHWTVPFEDMWPYGDVRSDDAYKGGGGTSDQGGYNDMELFSFMRPDQPKFDSIWFRLYVGISRADEALRKLKTLNSKDFPQKTEREAEMHFIRGHYYFLLKILFKHIPFFTADTPIDSLHTISNVQYTSQQLWGKIANEFQIAVNNLPDNQQDVGRPTKYAAEAYLAKVKLYQAYVQDKANNVVSINKSDLQQVVKLTSDVINSGKYGLLNNFGGDFMFKNDNTKFSVWAVQRSINDGTPNGRVDMGNALNYPMNPSYGCCWFHIPSQNLVNAFKTNKNGLPEFSTYNNSSIKDSVDFQNQTVDPRLDYTVGIPTHPWKDDPNFVYEKSWARTPDVYGYYSSMKEAQLPSCSCLKKVGPFYADSKNTVIIRYADVLLWKAEALIQLGRQNEALPLINKVREQAKNSKGSLKYSNGKPISDYHIETYKPGVNCTWTKDYALKALHWEDRLEFAMEGKRFFNLVRWGIADSVMNNYFNTEKARHQFLSNGHFQKNKDEYLPIPQNQINFSHGLYKQNYGWK